MILILLMISVCQLRRSQNQEAGGLKKGLSAERAPPYSRVMRNILLIILILLLIGAFPGWGYSSGWGYYPFGGLGLVLLIVVILALLGKI